ncbi:MAG: hypothetical protein K2F56_03490, partial [Anaeroplasmataceae bacterium]|nr:hypothetical protein [Anaeroplasmataceae bacterium]
MKKKSLILVLLILLFCSLGFYSNAATALKSTAPDVDVEEVKVKMATNTSFKGKYFKDGMYGYFYQVTVNNPIGSTTIQACLKNIDICDVSNYNIIDTNQVENGEMRIQLTRKPPVSTFVAFDNSATTRGYEYTLLCGLGYTTDQYSVERMASIEFNSIKYGYLYSSDMKEDTSSQKFKVDTTKRYAKLVLVGDVYITEVNLRQYQKLWFGDNKIWDATVNVYVFTKLWIR